MFRGCCQVVFMFTLAIIIVEHSYCTYSDFNLTNIWKILKILNMFKCDRIIPVISLYINRIVLNWLQTISQWLQLESGLLCDIDCMASCLQDLNDATISVITNDGRNIVVCIICCTCILGYVDCCMVLGHTSWLRSVCECGA